MQRAEEAEGKFEVRVRLLVLSKQPKKRPYCTGRQAEAEVQESAKFFGLSKQAGACSSCQFFVLSKQPKKHPVCCAAREAEKVRGASFSGLSKQA